MQQRLSSSRQSLSVFLFFFLRLSFIFCCSGFSDWLLFSMNIPFTLNVLGQLGCFCFFFFLFLPAFPCILLLGTKTSVAGLPSSSHAQVFLADSWLLCLPASLPHQALYLLNATATRPHPASPAACSCSSSASYVSGRPCSTISSAGLGVRVSTLSLKLPPSPPAWNGKCDKWNRTRLNFVWKFQTYDVQIGS